MSKKNPYRSKASNRAFKSLTKAKNILVDAIYCHEFEHLDEFGAENKISFERNYVGKKKSIKEIIYYPCGRIIVYPKNETYESISINDIGDVHDLFLIEYLINNKIN